MTAIRFFDKDVKLVYVSLTGKIKESKTDLFGRLTDLVDIKADQRLKPENQVADLERKVEKFYDEIGDKYYLVNPQISVSVNGKTFNCFASEFDAKVNKAIEGTVAKGILLFGPDVDIVYRAVMRQSVKTGALPNKPLSYCDPLSKIITSTDWQRMTPAARKEMYYPDTDLEGFYMSLFDAVYEGDYITLGE